MNGHSCVAHGTGVAIDRRNVRLIPSPLGGRRIRMQGTVQGVGFRPWVYRVARASAVTGRVRNDSAGVTIEAFGPPAALDAFVDRLAPHPPRPAPAGRPPPLGKADPVRGPHPIPPRP